MLHRGIADVIDLQCNPAASRRFMTSSARQGQQIAYVLKLENVLDFRARNPQLLSKIGRPTEQTCEIGSEWMIPWRLLG